MIQLTEFWTNWEGFLWEAEEERVAGVDAESEEAVDKNGGAMGGEGGAKAVYVAKVEAGRPKDAIEVRLEGE